MRANDPREELRHSWMLHWRISGQEYFPARTCFGSLPVHISEDMMGLAGRAWMSNFRHLAVRYALRRLAHGCARSSARVSCRGILHPVCARGALPYRAMTDSSYDARRIYRETRLLCPKNAGRDTERSS